MSQLTWSACPRILFLIKAARRRRRVNRPDLKETNMTESPNLHHAINYIEFSAVDIHEAKRFFRAAFDWEFNDYGPDYAGIRNRNAEGECGGICRADRVVTGGPLVILYSLNLESSLISVRQAGGTITKEIFSFPGGRRFHFCDTSGNELAVWSDQLPT